MKVLKNDASYDDYMRVAMSQNLAQSWASKFVELNQMPSQEALAFVPVSVIQFHHRSKPRFGLMEPYISEDQITGRRTMEQVRVLDNFTR